jgi:hypothetical protein
MTETPGDAAQVSDAQINAARTKLLIDKKLNRTSNTQVRRIAALKTRGEKRPIAS